MNEKTADLALRLLRRMSANPEDIPDCVPSFVELVSDQEITGLSEEALELLADLAHDLNWYEPDPQIRKHEGELWDERSVLEEARHVLRALQDLGVPL